ncbi:hypothetical protein [Mycolicibacterium goodii]|uniref:hypothetical protein n=1 Tax=Mycolicibacterium goodii TaxID=134601 RepID=UPI0012FFB8FD
MYAARACALAALTLLAGGCPTSESATPSSAPPAQLSRQDAIAVLTNSDEVDKLVKLEEVLGPLISELRDAPDERYMSDPRWDNVISAAVAALAAMNRS